MTASTFKALETDSKYLNFNLGTVCEGLKAYFLKIDIKEDKENVHFENQKCFLIKGNYKEVLPQIIKEVEINHMERNILPSRFKSKLLDETKYKWNFRKKGSSMSVGILSLENLSDIYNLGNNFSDDNPIITRNSFINRLFKDFAYSIALQNVNQYTKVEDMITDLSLVQADNLIQKASLLYDLYNSIPKGSLIATKAFHKDLGIYIGRKETKGFQKKEFVRCELWDDEPFLELNMNHILLNGIDKEPYEQERTLEIEAGFPMCVRENTKIIPANEEIKFLNNTINKLGKYNKIEVTNLANKHLSDKYTPKDGYHWRPNQTEFMFFIKNYLKL